MSVMEKRKKAKLGTWTKWPLQGPFSKFWLQKRDEIHKNMNFHVIPITFATKIFGVTLCTIVKQLVLELELELELIYFT